MIEALHGDLQKISVDCRILKGVKFSLKEKKRPKHTGERDILFVSLLNVSAETQARIQSTFDHHRAQWMTFPIKEKSKHLMVRFQQSIFNFGYWPLPWFSKFRVLPSKLPSRATIETTIAMNPAEIEKMSSYIDNIKRRKRRTIGRFDNEGYQQTHGALQDNRTTKRGHNCTSWVATAPIGPDGEGFMELLGADRSFNIGTNPGWWTAWLLSMASRDVSAIYWDHRPLEEMIATRIPEDSYFRWDFKRL